jgi:hypothetical protein
MLLLKKLLLTETFAHFQKIVFEKLLTEVLKIATGERSFFNTHSVNSFFENLKNFYFEDVFLRILGPLRENFC